MEKPYTMHVVSETHWDREWYNTFQEYRVQLVDLFDHLLDLMHRDPEYKYYMLDGQFIVVEDYLEIRPEKREEIAKLVQDGRLQIGPWYVLHDEFLTYPEGHIRNLLLGLRFSKALGPPMMVGYIPDEFGHITQMPQILNGFGIPYAFFSRGADTQKLRMEFIWQAPDGSEVVAANVGYCNAAKLPTNPEEAYKRIEEIKKYCAPLLNSEHLLLMNGCDHLEPQDELSEIIAGVNKLSKDRVVHSTLQDFFREVEKVRDRLNRHMGELRHNLGGGAPTLYGTISSRMYLKQANHDTGVTLVHWAEPFSAFAWGMGAQYPQAQLRQAWKYALQNLPHDSICGCSIDRVHDQMMTRFQWSQEIADTFTRRAFTKILAQANTNSPDGEAIPFGVFNASYYKRSDLIDVVLELPKDWPKPEAIAVFDDQGQEAHAIITAKTVKDEWRLDYFTMTSQQIINPLVITMLAEDVPSFGYRVYWLRPVARGPQTKPNGFLNVAKAEAENAFVRVQIHSDGSLNVTDKVTNRTYKKVHVIEDGGDVGGGYDYNKPEKDTVFTTEGLPAQVTLTESSPVHARYRIHWEMMLPVSANEERTARGEEKERLSVITYLTITAGSPRLDFCTIVDNTVIDHRMRVLFPTYIPADTVTVDGHFDLLSRGIKASEKDWPTEPQLKFVDLCDDKGGLAVFNQGLPEYEVSDDPSRTIKLTLFRSNSYVTKAWWPNVRSEKAKMLGRQVYRYALYPHSGDVEAGKVVEEANTFNLPLRSYQTDQHPGEGKTTYGFLTVKGKGIVVSALKKAEDRDTMIVRVYNPFSETKQGAITFHRRPKTAYLVDLNEERQRELTLEREGSLILELPAKKIISVEIVT